MRLKQTDTTTSLAVAQNLTVFWQIKSFYLIYIMKCTLENTWLRLTLLPLPGGNDGIAGLGVFTTYQHIWRSQCGAGEMPSSWCAMLFLFRIRTRVPSVGLQQKSNAPWWWLFVKKSIWFLFFISPLKVTPARNLTTKITDTDKGVTGCWQQAFPFSIS